MDRSTAQEAAFPSRIDVGERTERNRKHSAGHWEKPFYTIAYSGNENDGDEEYALVSMLSGLEGDHPLLLVSGLNTQATQMAIEYLTKEATAHELIGRLRAADPHHSGPWHFQAVLKTEVHDKVPISVSLTTVRVVR